MKRWVKVVIAINCIGANLAYGWAASNPCPIVMGYYPAGTRPQCGDANDGYISGLGAAVTWPSYMTTQIFKLMRANQK